MSVLLFVPGVPAPQGSARAFVRGNRAIITHDNKKTMPWRDSIAWHARARFNIDSIMWPRPSALHVEVDFVMPRRKAEPKRVTPAHTRKPDVDKLARAVLDALTGILFEDDSQVVALIAGKRTADVSEQPGAHIRVSEVAS